MPVQVKRFDEPDDVYAFGDGKSAADFVTIGDRSDSPPWDVAQRMDTDLGKVIHITPDGAPAALS